MEAQKFAGQRILILGAARQGLALARFLAARGAIVTVSDRQTAEQLAPARAALAGLPVNWALGGHPLHLLDQADVLCLSGGVPLTLPIVVEALRRGIPLSNDSQFFMQAVRGFTIGITGSAGKTTTTTLVGRMAAHTAAARGVKAWMGGNIGNPLVEFVEQIAPQDLVTVEFSSFQLEQMTLSPRVAAITNITPNHLDRHGTLAAYTAAKARILDFQTAADVAVLNREDPGAWALAGRVRGQLISFGMRPPAPGQAGSYLENDTLMFTDGSAARALLPASQVRLRGQHNLMNTLAACAIGLAAGFPIESLPAAVDGFEGVAHRLEFVRECNGARWYNDSIATAPERTSAAIHTFDEPLVLLLGGRDKKLPWDDLAALIHRRARAVITFGEAAGLIEDALQRAASPASKLEVLRHCGGLQEAVAAAARVARHGDVVLLSPGCTSYDEFVDFSERGEQYQKWVKTLS